MDLMPSAAALVCTLGSQTQVVTLSLDLLRRAGRWVSELVVVHTSAELEARAQCSRAAGRGSRRLAEYPGVDPRALGREIKGGRFELPFGDYVPRGCSR